jgi:segregation and condensation protein A
VTALPPLPKPRVIKTDALAHGTSKAGSAAPLRHTTDPGDAIGAGTSAFTSGSAADSDAVEASKPLDGVELLVSMARSGDIDPWNVDIAQVADQYLKAVAELKESDLRITGKTLLYLAILLRMKSDQLAGINYLDPPENEFLDELLDPDFMDGGRLMQPRLHFRTLDEVIKRRTSTKQPRIRTVTLDDLIRELRKYEELEKRRALQEKVEKASNRRMVDYADFTADDIEEMAHEEFHEDTVLSLRNILERILLHQEQVSLTEIMHEGRLDKISAYLALLFLAARGGFSMHQEEFYTELYVKPDDPQAESNAADTDLDHEELAG